LSEEQHWQDAKNHKNDPAADERRETQIEDNEIIRVPPALICGRFEFFGAC
jgi:hypothetical protein